METKIKLNQRISTLKRFTDNDLFSELAERGYLGKMVKPCEDTSKTKIFKLRGMPVKPEIFQ